MSEWQPIETAPKDGKLVLVYSDYDGHRTGCLHVNIHNGNMQWRDSDQYTIWQPTHWMPLPEPPAKENPQ